MDSNNNNNDTSVFSTKKDGFKISLEIFNEKTDNILRIECEDVKIKDSWLADVNDNTVKAMTFNLINDITEFKYDVLQDALTKGEYYKAKFLKKQNDLILQVDFKMGNKNKSFEITLKPLSKSDIEVLKSIICDLQTELDELRIMKPKNALLKVHSSTPATNGAWFTWNLPQIVTDSHFKHDGGPTITIVQDGLYQIIVRYISQGSSQVAGTANADLYVTGKIVARVNHSCNTNFPKSKNLVEILLLKANDTIMVKYHSNCNAAQDQFSTALTILLIS
eukprot:TRINITY_DN18575_c0_g1_i1.p1 TRINITY_DN18575_c0_g1~~TRINITY_DN18575_c0_g1_i1.p1  ORF type:complete len:278 (+),score=19.73 TRINITY_DN18575_c0_g1_i1:99-932(+)